MPGVIRRRQAAARPTSEPFRLSLSKETAEIEAPSSSTAYGTTRILGKWVCEAAMMNEPVLSCFPLRETTVKIPTSTRIVASVKHPWIKKKPKMVPR